MNEVVISIPFGEVNAKWHPQLIAKFVDLYDSNF